MSESDDNLNDNMMYIIIDYKKPIMNIIKYNLKTKKSLIVIYNFLIDVVNLFYNSYYKNELSELKRKYDKIIEINNPEVIMKHDNIKEFQYYYNISRLVIFSFAYLSKIFKDEKKYFNRLLKNYKNFNNLLEIHEELDELLILIENKKN